MSKLSYMASKGNFDFGSYDEINPMMLKMSAEFIVNLLGGIFRNGTKMANVIPLY